MSLSVHVTHSFGGFGLDAQFDAPDGATALFGRSGSGKTSLVNAVAGLLQPDQGRVVIGGQVLLDTAAGVSVPVHKRRIGYVFQDARLFPHLSVAGNLTYGRKRSGLPPVASLSQNRIVDMLGLGALLARRPGALSGGERQRVALGRALLSEPRLLLLDEPLAALDEARKAEILPYLERVRDERGVPILYVSHSVSEVARLATTVVALEDGRVLRAGPAAEVLSDPDTAPALGVREAGAILQARVVRHHDDGLTEVSVSGGTLLLPRQDAAPGREIRLRIAASDVLVSRAAPVALSALNSLPVTLETVRMGRHGGALLRLCCGTDMILSRISARAVERLGLVAGMPLFAVIESVSVAPRDIGDIGGAGQGTS